MLRNLFKQGFALPVNIFNKMSTTYKAEEPTLETSEAKE